LKTSQIEARRGDFARLVHFAVATIGPMEFTCSLEAVYQVKP
jgi:hypothetical protein